MKNLAKSETRTVAEKADESVRYLTPRVDITEDREGYALYAEMPGVNKALLELMLDGNELTIVGRRPAQPEQVELVYRESSPLAFRRVFELDPAIDTAKVTAKMENGLLELRLPKAERVKPRRITVTD